MILTRRNLLPAAIAGLAGLAVGCSSPSDPSPVVLSTVSTEDSINLQLMGAPNDPAGYGARASWKLEHGDAKGSIADWDLALKADSNYAQAYEMQAEVLYQLQQFEPCLNKLNECLQRLPDDVPCLLRRAEFAIHLNQFEDGFQWLNRALRINPQLHEAYWMKGKIYEATGANEKALSSYQTAVEVNPSFFDGYITLGVFLAKQQDPLAEEFYRSAAELRPGSIEPLYNLAVFLQDSGRFDDALALYREILAIDPYNATASFNQGFIHLEYLQAYDSAAHWFGEAIVRLPYYHQAFYNRGLALESMGQADAALADYSEALRFKPDYTAAALAKERVLETLGN